MLRPVAAIACLLSFAVACVEPPVAPPIAESEPPGSVEPSLEPLGVPLDAVRPDSCEGQSVTTSALFQNLGGREPGAEIEEAIDEVGCPITRITRRFNLEGQLINERFVVLNWEKLPAIYGSWAEYDMTHAYDATGRLVETALDAGLGQWGDPEIERFDGVTDASIALTYAGDDLVRRVTAGSFQSGYQLYMQGDMEETWTIEDGRVVREVQSYEHADYIIERDFDAFGNVTREESLRTTPEGELVSIARLDATFDALGRPLTRLEQGTYPSTANWRYEAGVLVELTTQTTFDPSNIRSGTTFFDAAGNAIRDEVDHPSDGVIDEIIERTFGPRGLLLSARHTSLGEVVLDVEYDYDDLDRLVETRYLPARWNAVTRVERTVFGADGEVLATESGEIDGPLSHRMTQSFGRAADGSLHIVARETDYDGDGEVDQRQAWIYDVHGNLLVAQDGLCGLSLGFMGTCGGGLSDSVRFIYDFIPEI